MFDALFGICGTGDHFILWVLGGDLHLGQGLHLMDESAKALSSAGGLTDSCCMGGEGV